MYRAMVGVGALCGLLIVTTYQLTLPVIERNKAEELKAAIFEVLPDAAASTTFRLEESGAFAAVDGAAAEGQRIHAGYDGERNLLGLAVQAHGMGYQDVIRLIYGYSPEEQAIVGIRVLESKETPGLGDKIETDPDFLQNFERLDVSLAEDGSRLAHPIVPVKHGEKANPWEVDGITGATISSEAVASILNASAQHWVPLIERRLNDFQEGD
jgi:electron transport complex protein RnfG